MIIVSFDQLAGAHTGGTWAKQARKHLDRLHNQEVNVNLTIHTEGEREFKKKLRLSLLEGPKYKIKTSEKNETLTDVI